jgi:hypothetical protein
MDIEKEEQKVLGENIKMSLISMKEVLKILIVLK